MKQLEVLKTVFPELITDNFEFIDYKESDTILEYWLDEREYMSREDYKRGCIRPYGFYCCPINLTKGKKRMSRLLIFSGRVSF